ncbi:LPXTG cell wall anchor domain-containing protein [Prauserella aidingensis]|nr:LPXTG cell wall anchor domain-containing protein [Prauserella aidingensis]
MTPQEPPANTGVPAGAVAAAGLALLAAGLTLLLWTRRRRAD